MRRALSRDQRDRLMVLQSTPEWKARHEAQMDAGIEAGTHVKCVICGNKDTRSKPEYDFCIQCGIGNYREADRERVIAEANRKAGRDVDPR